MIYLVFAFLLFYIGLRMKSWEWTEKDAIARIFMHLMFLGAAMFAIWWAYVYLVLPMEISKFSNAGAGLTYVNSAGGTVTIFNSSDESVLYYISYVRNDWALIESLKSYVWLAIGLFFAVFGMWWMWGHNMLGARMDGENDTTIEDQLGSASIWRRRA